MRMPRRIINIRVLYMQKRGPVSQGPIYRMEETRDCLSLQRYIIDFLYGPYVLEFSVSRLDRALCVSFCTSVVLQ